MFGVILVSSISTVTRVIGESDRKVCPFLSNIRLVMNAIQASLSDQAKKAPQAFTLQFITDPAGCKTTTRQSVWPAYTPHAPSKRSVCPPADPESWPLSIQGRKAYYTLHDHDVYMWQFHHHDELCKLIYSLFWVRLRLLLDIFWRTKPPATIGGTTCVYFANIFI